MLSQAGSIGTDRAKCAIYEMSHNRAYSQWLSLSASQLGLQHMVQQTEADAMNGSIYILYCERAHPVQIDEPFGRFHTLARLIWAGVIKVRKLGCKTHQPHRDHREKVVPVCLWYEHNPSSNPPSCLA